MKKNVLVGVLSGFLILAMGNILMPARAASDGLPVGTIIAWGGTSSSVPAGWMLCNGKALSKSTYPELFAAIGTAWGSKGDRFNLPDLRGRFLRGDDAGTGRDPDVKKRTPSNPGGSVTGVGSVQGDSFQNHSHAQNDHTHPSHYHAGSASLASGSSYICSTQGLPSPTGAAQAALGGATKYGTKSSINAGEETRPENAAVNFIIKVK